MSNHQKGVTAMKTEQHYDFRKKLLEIHEKGIRDCTLTPDADEFELQNNTLIYFEENDIVIKTAAEDFCDFLKTSMNIEASLTDESSSASIRIYSASRHNIDLKDANGYKGFMIECTEKGINIYSFDNRGAAQALYYLEDIMTFRKAPFIIKETIRKRPLFAPRMTHSGYGVDDFPDAHLAQMAHEGFDVVLLFVKGINETLGGHVDFKDLIKRCEKYGLDVYMYSFIPCKKNPFDPDAEEYYDNTFGKIFSEVPEFKGLILVGESIRFPSIDPALIKDTDEHKYFPPLNQGSAGYPCSDYKELTELIKKVINKHTKDVDVVLWSYNWGYQSEEARSKLIDSLPNDITLQATFETMDYLPDRDYIADYTLSSAGPGYYFKTDAQAAHKRGLKLYSMTNTGGRTWDFGVIPYEPMPHQWIKRYKEMRNAHEKWGLSGIMENHHYGWYPSFISKLAKHSFWNEPADYDKLLKTILSSEFGAQNYETVIKALELFSEAINYYVPSAENQYGSFRVGTAYPFCVTRKYPIPTEEGAAFGNCICHIDHSNGCDGRYRQVISIRVCKDVEFLKKMLDCMHKGVEILSALEGVNDKLDKLINLSKYIELNVASGINFKKWYITRCKFYAETDIYKIKEYLDELEAILLSEKEIAYKSLPLVDRDSCLGWEPSMLYIGHRENIEWKIEELERTRKLDLGEYRKNLSYSL